MHAFGQIRVLAQRNIVRFVRDHIAFRVAVMQSLVLALLAGLIYLQLDLTQSGIQNFAGGFLFVVVFTTFSAANPTFIQVPIKLPIVIREYRASLYNISSWYLAKNMSELPMQILQPIVFFVPVYLLMGIGHGFDVYLAMQVILMLVNSTAIGMGYMVSCLARRVGLAPIIGVVLFLPFLLFGGLLINSDDAPIYFVWIQYISPIKYGFEALMKLYWHRVAAIPCNTSVGNCVALTGSQVLQNFSMQDRSVFGDGLILLATNVSFRTIGLIALWIRLR